MALHPAAASFPARTASPTLPIGVNLRSIGVDVAWFRAQALRLEGAGYATIWQWDHFVSRGVLADPVLEAWTTLSFTAAATTRIGLGTFVANVMNRHPAVLARMAATFQQASGGRLVLGMGIGGHPAEHAAYGIEFPPVPERVARLTEAVAVIRALWTGGPVDLDGRFYRLRGAHAYPRPVPPPPIVVGGETTAGARLAARIGDGWTTSAAVFERDLPAYLATLAEQDRERAAQRVIVAFPLARDSRLAGSPWTLDRAAEAERWRAAGADEVILAARTTEDVDALVEAAVQR
ncbi:MAG: LLM class flavin-dependent oxidoreductase [Chloroflexi bacterium]|nr:LLM class flavin-dependent oxidoreductase [Chloroflexota bacterium]